MAIFNSYVSLPEGKTTVPEGQIGLPSSPHLLGLVEGGGHVARQLRPVLAEGIA